MVDVDSINDRSMVALPSAEENSADIPTMVAGLLNYNERLVKMFGMVYKLAEAAGEFGLANFLADRQDAHRKHGWMLRSSLQR